MMTRRYPDHRDPPLFRWALRILEAVVLVLVAIGVVVGVGAFMVLLVAFGTPPPR